MEFNIDFNAFWDTLPLMGRGMLGIFTVTIVIIIAMYLFNLFTGNNKSK